MNKSRLIPVLLIVLIISNCIFLWMVLKAHKRHEGPKSLIIEKLQFDNQQITKFESLIQLHRKEVTNHEERMVHLRSSLYVELKNSTPNKGVVDSLIGLISLQQKKAEEINFLHFASIKGLCKPNQIPLFVTLTSEFAYLFNPRPR